MLWLTNKMFWRVPVTTIWKCLQTDEVNVFLYRNFQQKPRIVRILDSSATEGTEYLKGPPTLMSTKNWIILWIKKLEDQLNNQEVKSHKSWNYYIVVFLEKTEPLVGEISI